nr:hypothetical protein [Tanacetum cinerariifolium]GEZ95167.1 hypothetical protein [Tanacetum cinerariifolium]
MDAPPSPNHVFNFPEVEFEEDPQEEPEEEFEEDPEEDPEEELEAEAENDVPLPATLPVVSPISPPPLSKSSSDTEDVAPIVANEALEMPPIGSTYENRNVHTIGLINANRIPWTEFKSMMTTEYCPTTKIQRMEEELWTLTLKGDDIEAYNNCFHELALMCPDLVSK